MLLFSVEKMAIGFRNCLFRCHFLKSIFIKEFKELSRKALYSLWKVGLKYCFINYLKTQHLSRTRDKLLYMFLEWFA